MNKAFIAGIKFFKQETVFCVSFVLAVISAFIVMPDGIYRTYPDYRTLALLFCLMIIVAGFQSHGVFALLGQSLIKRANGTRKLSVIMVLLCFFCSMVITNDVTLITFVPFTIQVYRMIGKEEKLLKVVVLETIGANLGSMATPIGNPQNIYLCSISEISMGRFFQAVLPYAGLALVMLLLVLWKETDEIFAGNIVGTQETEKKEGLFAALLPYLFLLGLCLLVVFRVLPYGPVLVCVAVVIFFVNRKLFKSVDYVLLLTFLCFFVFIGNMKRMPAVSSLLVSMVKGRELWEGILASQVISNVPAAVLLSGFTGNYGELLTGVNLGGLGTLIASLASLISFKFYSREFPSKKGAFFKGFTLWNVVFLGILAVAAGVLSRCFA